MDKVKQAAEEYAKSIYTNPAYSVHKECAESDFIAGVKWQSSNQSGEGQWVKASERQPNHTKHVFAKNEKGTRFTAFYTKVGYPIEMEWEDEDDLPDYVINDTEKGQLYLKKGWYEERENTGTDYEYIFCERDIVEWLDESAATPSPSR